MKHLRDFINEEPTKTSSFSLSYNDIDKILYSLAFAAAWSNISTYDVENYKELFNNLLQTAKKSFKDTETLPENWSEYDLTHRGSVRRLN